MPELWGGSADLAESNNTTMEGEPSFIPRGKQTREWKGGPYGRTLHFGIRENGMGMILNGIALEGLTRPYGGTFLVFSDYMRPAVRLAAIQQLPVTYVWTHDSIGLGEDGPTHQPVEHLAALRAIPGLDVVRPADANETAAAWAQVLRNKRTAGAGPDPAEPPGAGPQAVRQDVRCRQGRLRPRRRRPGRQGQARRHPHRHRLRGLDRPRGPREARGPGHQHPRRLHAVPRVVRGRRQGVPEPGAAPDVRARVSIEAAVSLGWHDLVGDAGRSVSIEHFGASADYKTLYREFGLTPEAVVKAAKDSLKDARATATRSAAAT